MVLKVRIIIFGDHSVGKTTMTMKYFQNNFIRDHKKTLAIELQSKILKNKKQDIELNIWEIAGDNMDNQIIKSWIRYFDIIFFIYDISNKQSFKNIKSWIHNFSDKNVLTFLIGNKKDMPRQVSYQDGLKLAEEHSINFIEFSTKNDNVKVLIDQLVFLITAKQVGDIHSRCIC